MREGRMGSLFYKGDETNGASFGSGIRSSKAKGSSLLLNDVSWRRKPLLSYVLCVCVWVGVMGS